MLGRLFEVEEASLLDGLFLGGLSLDPGWPVPYRSRHRLVSDCSGICGSGGGCSARRDVDARFELTRKVVVLKKDAILKRLMPMVDLPLVDPACW